MRSILKLVIRLLVISGWVRELSTFANYLSATIYQSSGAFQRSASATSNTSTYLAYGGTFLVGVILLAVVWWKTDWIVKLLVGEVEETALTINLPDVDIVPLALRILGFFLIFTSIPTLAGIATYYIYTSKGPGGLDVAGIFREDATLIATVLTGLGLIIGGERIKRFFIAVHNGFMLSEDDETEEEGEREKGIDGESQQEE